MKKLTPGFTIVELLVVIVVISILASIVVLTYKNTQRQSRDDNRTTDITIIKHGLENYHRDHGEYPAVCPGGDGYACNVSYLETALHPYINEIPHDPVQTGADDYQYARHTPSADAQDADSDIYALYIHYEVTDACKTGRGKIPSDWFHSAPLCTD